MIYSHSPDAGGLYPGQLSTVSIHFLSLHYWVLDSAFTFSSFNFDWQSMTFLQILAHFGLLCILCPFVLTTASNLSEHSL